jgi:hypothetical protein
MSTPDESTAERFIRVGSLFMCGLSALAAISVACSQAYYLWQYAAYPDSPLRHENLLGVMMSVAYAWPAWAAAWWFSGGEVVPAAMRTFTRALIFVGMCLLGLGCLL